MCSVPSSLPFLDSDTATFEPSGEATYQSISVWPAGSVTLGFSTSRREAGSAAAFMTISQGCCRAGSV